MLRRSVCDSIMLCRLLVAIAQTIYSWGSLQQRNRRTLCSWTRQNEPVRDNPREDCKAPWKPGKVGLRYAPARLPSWLNLNCRWHCPEIVVEVVLLPQISLPIPRSPVPQHMQTQVQRRACTLMEPESVLPFHGPRPWLFVAPGFRFDPGAPPASRMP